MKKPTLPQCLPELGRDSLALMKWLLLTGLIGILVGSVSSVFSHTLIFANNLRSAT